MLFITTVFGDGYVPFLNVFLDSVKKTHPSEKVIIQWNNVSEKEIRLLKFAFPNYDFVQVGIEKTGDMSKDVTLKINTWQEVCRDTNEENVCIIDCDTIVRENVSDYFNKDFDFLFTWKQEKFPLNLGVILLKNSEKTRSFFDLWTKRMQDIFNNKEEAEKAIHESGAVDQAALRELLDTQDYSKSFTRKYDFGEVKFLGVPCSELNETNSVPLNTGAKILHYKGGWRPILLELKGFGPHRTEENSAEMKELWEESWDDFSFDLLKKFAIDSAKKHEKDFDWDNEVYEERGILHSEMLCVISLIKEMGADVIIESGRARGQSTKILGEIFKDIPVVSIEWERDDAAEFAEQNLAKYKNIELLYGDTNQVLPQQLERFKDKKVAVLFDGPKGEDAYKCLDKSLVDYSNIVVAFFHDCRQSYRRMINPSRESIYKYFDRLFFTDDLDYVKEFSRVDKVCIKKDNINIHSWRPYLKGFAKIGSYGPTIGVVVPNERDRFRAKNKYTKATPVPQPVQNSSLVKKVIRKVKHVVTS